jgi:2-phosphosulfolactate phosphatase
VTFDQSEFEIRCEWSRNGLETLAPISDVVIIVDVLSFSTAVDVALGRRGSVLPFPLKSDAGATYAASTGAVFASAGRGSGFSLSPASLQSIPCGL